MKDYTGIVREFYDANVENERGRLVRHPVEHDMTCRYLERHLPTILRLYRPRQEAMLAAMDRYFPAGFTWSQPEGGMFVWAEGPEGLDAAEFCECCIACSVAFVPGKYFYTEPGAGLATMRFNYTMIDEQAINDAVRTVAEVYAEQMSST